MSREYLRFSSFGDLLKQFRKRKRWTQHVLADRVGVHYNTIGIWERGEYLPESKTVVLEIAHQLRLSDQETRHLLEASLTSLSPYWMIPFQRNHFFTGRDEILETLHKRLCGGEMVTLTQSYALHGLGGIGKTQIALEYAYRHALEYSAIFWIEAETLESIVVSLVHIGDVLQLPEREVSDLQHIVIAVQRWLSTHNQWLLIWDNLEEMDLLQRFLPPTRQGAILITTRCQIFGTLAVGLELTAMGQEEGVLFLLRRAKVLGSEATSEHMHQFAQRLPGEYAAAEELVQMMDGLPLALDQAGAYIDETGCSLSGYLQRYDQQQQQFLDRRGAFGGDHPHSVVATFRISCQRVEESNRAALELLRICAFLSPDAIPEELFVKGASHLGPLLGPVASDLRQLDLALAALRRVSLVQRHPETQTLSLHRLVQIVLQEEMSEQERASSQQRIIDRLNALFPEVSHDVWKQCERLLPHVLLCATFIPDQTENQELADVLRKAADYLLVRAQYEQAEQLYQRALRIREQALGSEHAQVAYPLHGLARLFAVQGKYKQAEPLYQRVLHIWEQALGVEHPQLARILTALALLSAMRAQYEQAEQLCQRALRIVEQALGMEHPQIARTLTNLADLYSEQGKYTQAESLFEKALHIWEQAGASAHPDVAYPLNNLADLYTEQGKHGQAELLYERALYIWEQVLGSEHPRIAHPLQGLARLHMKQEEYEQAETLYERALHIQEQRLGQSHPDTAKSLAGLAQLYVKQGKEQQAEPLLKRACAVFEDRLGLAHPKTVQAVRDYHLLLQHLASQQDQPTLQSMTIAVRGDAGQVAYTRTVSLRQVIFTCTICGQTVTQLHYPSGKMKYCSDACKTVGRTQSHEKRVHKQREKRQAERKAFK